VLADGDLFPLLTDGSGNLLVAVASSSPTSASKFVSAAYEASHVRVGVAKLRSGFLSSKAAAAGFWFVYDANAVPANGTLPDFPPIPVPVGPAFVSLDLAEERSMALGIVFVFSSTQATLTIATADCWFEGHFF